ncbi:PAS domain-containing protein [Archangium lansingense]|uniref:histidine kinase n=1 Tax=Archangium lansingense TaxID=2995310 RepID=A0ABT4A469_9BACT|nr:PAS domain-containing protein [Archangium lansinium]MCY1076441.1 PAS domain-containing protein [Archangium lansinium]
MKLLLVSPQVECSVGQLLSGWGHEVRHAPGVEQVGALLQGVEGVLVVGTSNSVAEDMARLSTAEVRPRPFLLAVVPASAEQVPLDALLAAAVDDFLLMPFEPAQLQNRIEWLARRRKVGMQAPVEDPRSRDVHDRLSAIIQTQSEIANAGLELGKVMSLIAERAMRLCGASGTAVALAEGDELVYEVTHGNSMPHRGFRLKLSHSLTGMSILRGEVLHTRDTEDDPRVNVAATRATGIRSMIIVPLRRIGSTVGAINVSYPEPNAYDDLDVRTLEMMGRLLGAAMSNAAEFEAKQTLVDELATTLAALQQSQELFQSFMNHSPVLAFMKDSEGRRVWVNESCARFFQCDMESLRGRTDAELLPAMTAARLRREDKAVLSTGQPLQSEQVVPAPDGTPHYWLNHKFLLRDTNGRQLLGGVSIDITARKQAEKALRRSEESFRALIEGLPEAIFAHRGGRLLYINPAGLAFLDQRSVEDVAGMSLLELIHLDDRAEAATVLEGSLEKGPATTREVRFLRTRGPMMSAELSAMRLLFDGEPATVVSARNITERKQMQARLLLADRLASVGTLASGVAHEINNPLAFVLSNLGFLEEECQLLRSELPRDRLSEMEDVLRETKQGAERVRHIVRDLRTLSRDEGEQLSDVDVRGVIESSLGLVRHELRHRARLVKELEPVPVVRASEGRLGQVLLNLLINAAHAIPDGRPGDNEVRVRLRAIAGHVVIEVLDTGSGIPPEVRDRIFDPFFTTKPVGMGTGLGLSICHGIVTGMGGDITVESEVGRGSTFRITLPIPQAAPEDLDSEDAVSA